MNPHSVKSYYTQWEIYSSFLFFSPSHKCASTLKTENRSFKKVGHPFFYFLSKSPGEWGKNGDRGRESHKSGSHSIITAAGGCQSVTSFVGSSLSISWFSVTAANATDKVNTSCHICKLFISRTCFCISLQEAAWEWGGIMLEILDLLSQAYVYHKKTVTWVTVHGQNTSSARLLENILTRCSNHWPSDSTVSIPDNRAADPVLKGEPRHFVIHSCNRSLKATVTAQDHRWGNANRSAFFVPWKITDPMHVKTF